VTPVFKGDSETSEWSYEGNVVVVLHTIVDDEMRNESLSRKISNKIQKLRKAKGLKETDKISVSYTPVGSLAGLLSLQSDKIQSTIGVPFTPGDRHALSSSPFAEETVELGESKLHFWFIKH